MISSSFIPYYTMNEKAISLKLASSIFWGIVKIQLKREFSYVIYSKKRGYLAILLNFKKDHVQSPRA